MDRELKVRHVEAWPKKAGKGDYLKFLKGERLTQRQSIKAMCYSCCCGEPTLCDVSTCPLTPYNQQIFKNDASGSPCTAPDSEKLFLAIV